MEDLAITDIKPKNVLLILMAALLIPLAIFLPLAADSWENTISVNEAGISVSGSGGFELSWEEIELMELVEELTQLKPHTRKYLKGDFETEEGQVIGLVINGEAPFILISVGGKKFFVNRYYAKETRRVFHGIQEVFERKVE